MFFSLEITAVEKHFDSIFLPPPGYTKAGIYGKHPIYNILKKRGEIMRTLNWHTYLVWIALIEAVGAVSGWLTRGGMQQFMSEVTQPTLSPPPIVFPIVWTVLFALMGIGVARVWAASSSPARCRALAVFALQLAFNFCWSIIFFNFRAFGLAFFWLLAMWLLILAMISAFRQVNRTAARLQLPYLIWVTFAAYLNLAVWLIN